MSKKPSGKLTTSSVVHNGHVKIPQTMRTRLGIQNGASVTLLQVGQGLLLIPEDLQLEKVRESVSRTLQNAGITEQRLQAGLAKVRRKLAKERYPELFQSANGKDQ